MYNINRHSETHADTIIHTITLKTFVCPCYGTLNSGTRPELLTTWHMTSSRKLASSIWAAFCCCSSNPHHALLTFGLKKERVKPLLLIVFPFHSGRNSTSSKSIEQYFSIKVNAFLERKWLSAKQLTVWIHGISGTVNDIYSIPFLLFDLTFVFFIWLRKHFF